MNNKITLSRYKYIHPLINVFLATCYLAMLTGCKKEGTAETRSLVGQAPRKLTKADIAELETYFRKTMKYLKVPGASVAIVLDG
jgi:hypothetical protein